MFCPKCGTRIHEASQFCVSCGARLSDLGVAPGTIPPAAADPAPMAAAATTSAAGLYAGFWRRVAASIIDSIVLVIGTMFVAAVAVATVSDEEQAGGMAYLLSVVVAWLYSALMESSNRQATLGKMAIGIKVTDADGKRIGFGRATGRHFAKIVSSLTLGIGFVMAGFTRRRQALHDMVAGTLVAMKDASDAQLAARPEAPPVSGLAIAMMVLAVAIVPVGGILAAIAIPAYQDYTIRAQVSDGLMSASAYKAAVAEVAAGAETWEEIDNQAIGLGTDASSSYLESIKVMSGVIVLNFGGQAAEKISGATLLLVPGITDSGDVRWVCGLEEAPPGLAMPIDEYQQYTDVEPKYLPSACRGR